MPSGSGAVQGGGRIEAAARRLAHRKPDEGRQHEARDADSQERRAPVDGARDGAADHEPERAADGDAEGEDAECLRALGGAEIVAQQRVGRRGAAGFADADPDAREKELREVLREAAGRRERAPQRECRRDDPDTVRAIGEPAERDAERRVEQRECSATQ